MFCVNNMMMLNFLDIRQERRLNLFILENLICLFIYFHRWTSSIEIEEFVVYSGFTWRKGGIKIFEDDKELERGKPSHPDSSRLLKNQDSLLLFSRETTLIQLGAWMNFLRLFAARTRVVHKWFFSIFFEVEPTVVRKQTRSFHEAFAKHEEAFRESTEKVQNWRHALTEVANPPGWHLKDR